MKIVMLQILETDDGTFESLALQLPNKPYVKLVDMETIEGEFKELIKSFVKSAKEVYLMEGDEILDKKS